MGIIYAIENLENGKVYIGSTVNPRSRWLYHKSSLRRHRHHNSHLQSAWDYYGEDAFEFVVVEDCIPDDDLIEAEQCWLDRALTCGPVYNQGTVVSAPWLGCTRSAETCAKVGAFFKGRSLSRKHRQAISAGLRGHQVSEETRRRLAQANGRSYPAFIHRETGEIIPAGDNLSALCREVGLSQGHLSAVARGDRARHKGWELLLPASDAPALCRTRNYPSFIHRDTDEIIPAGHNLSALCREYGLERGNMGRVASGYQGHHKGWELQCQS